MGRLEVIPIPGLPEIREGDNLGRLIFDAAIAADAPLTDGDCLVVTQKVVSKGEGRIVELDPLDPAARRRLIIQESRRVLRRRADLFITETNHGFVCANSGIDVSNIEEGKAALLPIDSDRSARGIRDELGKLGADVAVVITDTFGRTWRNGLTDVAIGIAGIAGVVDLRGLLDTQGRELQVTEVAVADEIAGAAELVMGKSKGVAAAIVRGLAKSLFRDSSARDLVRAPRDDLFR